jgi:diadenosine tetraphosphate (Ap4A) HIT family hydrolase
VEDRYSEINIRSNCPFCDQQDPCWTYLLEETNNFRVICEYNPLKEGHILIIPKQHIPSIGEYPDNLFAEFKILYEKVSNFILSNYGSLSTFEHGRIGQTIFHSHIHLLPFSGNVLDIIPEGKSYLKEIENLESLRGKTEYLFFSIGNKKWLVDTTLGAPRFFRDRFAKAMGTPERSDWKVAQQDPSIKNKFDCENIRCRNLWIKNQGII